MHDRDCKFFWRGGGEGIFFILCKSSMGLYNHCEGGGHLTKGPLASLLPPQAPKPHIMGLEGQLADSGSLLFIIIPQVYSHLVDM